MAPPFDPTAAEVQRDIGRHDAQIEGLKEQIRQIHTDNKAMAQQLEEIKEILAGARGGWKTLMAVAGLASIITGMVLHFLDIVSGGSRK